MKYSRHKQEHLFAGRSRCLHVGARAHTPDSRWHISPACWPTFNFVFKEQSLSRNHWAKQTLRFCLMKCSLFASCEELSLWHNGFVFDCLSGCSSCAGGGKHRQLQLCFLINTLLLWFLSQKVSLKKSKSNQISWFH